jgi:hypothetical protein
MTDGMNLLTEDPDFILQFLVIGSSTHLVEVDVDLEFYQRTSL